MKPTLNHRSITGIAERNERRHVENGSWTKRPLHWSSLPPSRVMAVAHSNRSMTMLCTPRGFIIATTTVRTSIAITIITDIILLLLCKLLTKIDRSAKYLDQKDERFCLQVNERQSCLRIGIKALN